jgi:3-hydroxyisobutyrate dehydrogenase
MIALCEALLYGYKCGLDLESVFKSVSVGAAGSKALEVLGPRILARNFEPGFYVEHFIKDMGIALKEAERMNLSLPGLALAKQLYESVRAIGYGRKGTQALMLALEAMSGIKR